MGNGAENTFRGGTVYARGRTLAQVKPKSLANGLYGVLQHGSKISPEDKTSDVASKPEPRKNFGRWANVGREDFRGARARLKGEPLGRGRSVGESAKKKVGTLYSG